MMDQARPGSASILDNLPGMIFRCRHESRRTLLFVSAGCRALTGHPPETLVGEGAIAYETLLHPDDLEPTYRQIDAAQRQDQPYTCTYRLLVAGDRERWVRESGRPDATDPTILEGLIIDATDQVQALVQLERRATDQTRKLTALYDILESASAPGPLYEVLDQSLQRILVAVKGDAGFIHLRQKGGQMLRLVASVAIPEAVEIQITDVSAKNGLVAWVTQNREPLLITDTYQDNRTIYLSKSGALKVYVGVPISRGRQVWGALSVLGKKPDQFRDEEVALLASIGEEIGIVVENARLRRHAERLLVMQERNRLARELHDSVTQSLYSLTLFAEAGRRVAKAGKEDEAADYFLQIGETGQQALKEMRLLLHRLRPSILAKEGLVRALQQRLNAVEGRAGVKHHFLVSGEAKLSPALEEALYHIAQEALNNALKHALADEVTLRLNMGNRDRVTLAVEDNGRGFDLAALEDSDGLGMATMQERAKAFSGEVSVDSAPGRGTIVQAYLRDVQVAIDKSAPFDVEDLP